MADEKTYVSDIPRLMEEWNWEKNTEFAPNKLTVGSNKKVWWRCSEGHEWQASPNHRNNGTRCPYCAGKKVLRGFNDLQTVNPILADEWNYEKNHEITPEEVTISSGKKVWWKCAKGHEWQATIANRNIGLGCPYCSGRYAIIGENDLQTVNPTLASEWNYEKNNGLTPMDVLPNSNKKVWWRCAKGHEWQATVTHRSIGRGCPYCYGRYAIKGENDLKTINPFLANEWNYEKNHEITPEEVTISSGKKVWWKCAKGHEWQATLNGRNSGHGCPVCNSERHTSFPEFAIVFYLKKYGFDVIHPYKTKDYELDIYIPEKKTAIEYDGSYWHKNKIKNDLEKNRRCEKDGIKLYRIRENLPPLYSTSTDYIIQNIKIDLPKSLVEIFNKIIDVCVDVDLERDTIAIDNLREFTEKENSLLYSNPKLASEWNYEKNGILKPELFAANSGKKVWWQCKQGHAWQATIMSRNKGSGCPYCWGRLPIQGKTDLQTVSPDLAKEWNYEKNNGLTPADITSNSNKYVWWKCSKGHEWEAVVANRNSGTGCPECAKEKRKAQKG